MPREWDSISLSVVNNADALPGIIYSMTTISPGYNGRK